MSRQNERGLSLIEVMVVVTIIGILLMLSVPSFGNWIANSRVRSVAEEVQNGVRLAQAEAVRRNRQVVFALTAAAPALDATPTVSGANWFVRVLPLAGETVDESFYVTGGSFAQNSNVTVAGPAVLCFNSIGRQVANASTGLGVDCSAPAEISAYDISRAGSDRAMRVQAHRGGRVRACDPAKSIATQPDGC
jgi:type IV fimbrial biogenesis protein FimT